METNNTPALLMTVSPVTHRHPITGARTDLFVAHGPDGHTWLLSRLTEDAARVDGLAYFLATRRFVAGHWVL